MKMIRTLVVFLALSACTSTPLVVPEERCEAEWEAVRDACYVGWAAQNRADARATELGCVDPIGPLYAYERATESRERVVYGWAVDEYVRLNRAETCEELSLEPEMPFE